MLTDSTTFKYESDDELTPEKEWKDAFDGGGRTLRYLRDWTEAATYLSDLNKVLPEGISDSRAMLAAVEQGVKRLKLIEQAMREHGVNPPATFWDGRVETRVSALVGEDEEKNENKDAQPPF